MNTIVGKIKSSIFIIDDNTVLLEDLCDAIRDVDKNIEVKEYSLVDEASLGSHIIFDVGVGTERLYNVLNESPILNVWLISGRSLSAIEKFRKEFNEAHPKFRSRVRKAIFQKPLDEERLLAVIRQREEVENQSKDGFLPGPYSEEITVHLNFQWPARLIDSNGVILSVNESWGDFSPSRPKLSTNFKEWYEKLKAQENSFLKEKQWQYDDEAESELTKGYYEVHSYAMRKSGHIIQYIISSDDKKPWQSKFSEDELIDLCKPVMEVLVNNLFTRARLYRVNRFPKLGLYKRALYSVGGKNISAFEGINKANNELSKRIHEYENLVSQDYEKLVKKIVKVASSDSYWDKKIGMEGVPNWLEVPVLVPGRRKKWKTVALLIFDRKDAYKKLWNYEELIQEKEILSTNKLLLGVALQIARLFEYREKQEYFKIQENIRAWRSTIDSEHKADELAINAFSNLLKSVETDDGALIRLRGLEAVTLQTKTSIVNPIKFEDVKKYDLTPITSFNETICVYPDLEAQDVGIRDLESWNQEDFRIFIPTRSGNNVWYIFCFSRRFSGIKDEQWEYFWTRFEKNYIEGLVFALGDYLNEQYNVKLTANSMQRIFIHEAITLFGGVKNSFPEEFKNNNKFIPINESIYRLQNFLENMRMSNNSTKSHDKKCMPSIKLNKIIIGVVNNFTTPMKIRKLSIIGLNRVIFVDLFSDEFLFELVIANLVNNAVRYAPEGSEIAFSSNTDDNYWEFTITNKLNDLLTLKQLDNIFDEYISYPQGARSQGIGIGLSNSRNTARKFGGELSVEQIPSTKCISFTLHWPLYNSRFG